MKRGNTSRNSHRDEKPKPSRNEDSDAVLRARTEEERQRRRREWVIEQEKLARHNRLKRKMAMEYEIRRARNMGLPLPEGRCNSRRSRSGSPPGRQRRTSEHCTPKVNVLSKKFETSSGTTPLFKGPEGTKISSTELRKIKVDIHRNIPGRLATDELKRDILNKEDVVLKRRAGEGSKPIFDREEIKRAVGETDELEEHRTVATVNLENSEDKLKTLKRHSASLSRTRTRSHPRYDDSKLQDKGSYRSDREKDHNREREEGERSYRNHRERPRDHSRDRRKADRSRERDRLREEVPRERYVEPIPVPIYYGNFQPRPLMVGPWGPIQGPFGGHIYPPMMRPSRTFLSRSMGIPPDIYGFRPPLERDMSPKSARIRTKNVFPQTRVSGQIVSIYSSLRYPRLPP